MPIRYEDFSLSDEKYKDMLDFFDISFSVLAEEAYTKRNSQMDIKSHVFAWMQSMSFSDMNLAQSYCQRALELYGYRFFTQFSYNEYQFTPLLEKPQGFA